MTSPLSLWKGDTLASTEPGPPRPTMRAIAVRVCEKHHIAMADLEGPSAARRFSRPRQEAMHEMAAMKLWSLTQIGRFLGGRDHTTVLHGVRAHERRLLEQGERV